MKFIFFIFLVLVLIGFKSNNTSQQKYLPVFISLYDTTFLQSELLLNLKASFSIRKIKTISKKDAEAYINSEAYAVTESYLKSGGDLSDIAKKRRYQSANMQNVANSLLISIRINADGIINDTVKWDNHSIPINFENFPKTNWHFMLLDSTNAKTLLQMSQSIVDSIIASKVLVKD